jgi:hypothetical protein
MVLETPTIIYRTSYIWIRLLINTLFKPGYVSCGFVCIAALAALSATAIIVIVVTFVVWTKDLIRLTLHEVSM